MSTRIHNIGISLAALLCMASIGLAQGIKIKRNAVVLYGSAANCSRPATVDHKKVQKATAEWKTIRSEGVTKGSARYQLLMSKMNERIRSAVARAADSDSCDCVVRKGDITNANGLKVRDLTQEVIGELDS